MTTVGNQDDLVCQGFWGFFLSLGSVVPKAGLFLLCGLSFKNEPTPNHPTHPQPCSAASVGSVTCGPVMSLLADKTIVQFWGSWEDM